MNEQQQAEAEAREAAGFGLWVHAGDSSDRLDAYAEAVRATERAKYAALVEALRGGFVISHRDNCDLKDFARFRFGECNCDIDTRTVTIRAALEAING